MIRLYSIGRVETLLGEMAPLIERVSADYGVPAAFIRAILFREMKEIDLFDAAADLAVRNRLLSRLSGRKDCSTGYAQIFAAVAIRALQFAETRGLETARGLGLPADPPLSPAREEDLRLVWLRLYRDREFNLRMAALNMLAAADETVGRTDFASFTPDELKLAFSRYNANTCRVTRYGEETYGYYLRWLAAEKEESGERNSPKPA